MAHHCARPRARWRRARWAGRHCRACAERRRHRAIETALLRRSASRPEARATSAETDLLWRGGGRA
eukprot:scaffold25539_cov60-Phaeocystis_antarctica.AAC.2